MFRRGRDRRVCIPLNLIFPGPVTDNHMTQSRDCCLRLSFQFHNVILHEETCALIHLMPTLPIPLRTNGLQIRSSLQVRSPLIRILMSLKQLTALSLWSKFLEICSEFISWKREICLLIEF